MKLTTSIILLMLSTLLVGCGKTEPQFTHREEFDELLPEAQQYVDTVMLEYFGTPTQMVAWEQLPVHYHGAIGVVGEYEAPEQGSVSQLPLTITDQVLTVKPGSEVQFLSGPLAAVAPTGDKQDQVETPPTATTYTIETFDESTGMATFDPALPAAPQEGDQLAIEPGETLNYARTLYAEHCVHCHGVSGDGNGPTARYLNPPPRDYRLGKFKFTSTQSSLRAAREDLSRILDRGIPGTYMPSFKLLTEEENRALVEYVMWLSMRGETETRIVRVLNVDYSKQALEERSADEVLAELREYLEQEFPEEFADDSEFLADNWINSQSPEAQIVPGEHRKASSAESIAKGREIYLSARAKCASCHGDTGLGNGPQTVTLMKNPLTNEEYNVPGLFDDWGNPIRPRNLTRGIYRGGRRPVDLYRRVHAGIKGTPMPAFGTVLKDDEIWDLVNYVMSVPFEEFRLGAGKGQPGSEAPATEPTAPQEAQPAEAQPEEEKAAQAVPNQDSSFRS